ncbi:PP2C family protein-serine/threonine phosphatase [Neobacillus sp. 114]|uniref:PP2C family protein-serine/threonine phosphatase n=1 Tax=Neobacillus sp. 114 TaxID=3048535 RepID=UPI0024C33C28|nr:PP2C family protein-serine/threonine phosphatase [Neobacillus sp. 114]
MDNQGLSQKNSDIISHNKTLEREINLAKKIQTKLLNGEKPKLGKDDISGVSIPARLIGGDYFDFYPLPNGKLRIVIGDVMGKGIPAAMLMILTRGAFRTAAESTTGPGGTLTAMNNATYQDLRKLNSFVTVFCADWEPETGILTYANAGHSLPEVIKKNGERTELPKVKGVMIGGLSNQIYHEEKITLSEGDVVCLYTDGIIEALNRKGELYKKERLEEVLKQHVDKSASEIEGEVINSVMEFTEKLPQKDDITMVVLKVGEESTDIYGSNSLSLKQ